MDQIGISVIIPVYNVGYYLEECLDSVLNQKFQNYEIICINDGSTDNSGEILSIYQKKYNKIRVITHLDNKGPSVARNIGIHDATGKYIMFIDSDDFIEDNTLEELYNKAENTEVDIIYFNMVNFHEGESAFRRYIRLGSDMEYEGIYSGKELFCCHMNDHQMNVQAVRKFIRKKFIDDKKISFYEGILHEDVLSSFYCAMEAEKVININREYYIRRLREGSITHTKDYRRGHSLFVVAMNVLSYWNTHVFTEKENCAIEFFFREIYNSYQRYSWQFETETTDLEVGGYAEKVFYSMLHGVHKNNWLTLDESQITRVSKAENVIIFGAGAGSMDIVNILETKRIKVNVVAVSDINKNPKSFCGIKVDSIDNIANYIKNAIVIIGVTEKYASGIANKLEQLGYNDIVIAKKVPGIYKTS